MKGTSRWDPGSGWLTRADRMPGPRGIKLLATSDVDHDGHPELISYQLFSNDYGIEVFADLDRHPIYAFNCGNI